MPDGNHDKVWVTLTVPRELVERIDEQRRRHGDMSRASYIRWAIQTHITEHNDNGDTSGRHRDD